jgi:hypothetical protein
MLRLSLSTRSTHSAVAEITPALWGERYTARAGAQGTQVVDSTSAVRVPGVQESIGGRQSIARALDGVVRGVRPRGVFRRGGAGVGPVEADRQEPHSRATR